MEVIEMLNLFCDPNGYRDYYKEPFFDGKHTIATDGKAVIQIEGHFGFYIDGYPKDVCSLFESEFSKPMKDKTEISAEAFELFRGANKCKECAVLSADGIHMCPECIGHGNIDVESDYNSYSVTCKTCKGYRYLQECYTCGGSKFQQHSNGERILWDIGKQQIDPKYISKALKLPGLVFYPGAEKEPLRCVFDRGEVLIMPCL